MRGDREVQMIYQICCKEYAPWGNSQGLCKPCWNEINNDTYDRGDAYDKDDFDDDDIEEEE
jgi:hypothetical protein